jgi:vitamin B12 transporter
VKSFNRTSGDWYEGRDLARRPRHALTLAADWRTPLYGLSLGSDLRVVSSSYDSQFSNQQLPGYALVTLRAAAPLGHGVEIYGRVENLTDAQYQTAAGYATAGRSAYLGARARF